jgi:beta-mannosidase
MLFHLNFEMPHREINTNATMNRLLRSTIIIGFSLFFITFFVKVNHAQTPMTIQLNDDWHFQPTVAIVPPNEKDLGRNINADGYKTKLPNTALNALYENGAIEDPYYRTNEKNLQWLEKKDWIFDKTFDVSPELLKSEKIDLILRGVDTYADVMLNDALVYKADNMFRTWKADVRPYLKEKGNVLRIVFTSPLTREKIMADDALVDYPDVYNTTRVYSRKAQYHYGWDWGPRYVSCGLQSAELQAWTMLQIEDVFTKQISLTREKATLETQVTINSTKDTTVTVTVTANGKTFSGQFYVTVGSNTVSLSTDILYPNFWWTHSLGTPFLYKIDAAIQVNSHIYDKKSTKIGLRTLELVTKKDAKGESFYFELNGFPVFIKGANYIPKDMFLENVKREHHQQIIEDAVSANMNMLRIWGGGVYETDAFYDICDEKGVLVWQDFMYACAMYPGDEKFLQNAESEAIEQVKRLRTHPSIALWCGNNEINEAWHNWGWQPRFNPDQKEYIWGAYKALFNKILPEAVAEYSNKTPYWESSPRYGRYNEKSYTEGDNHDWFVWHDERPFEHFEQKIPRFMSEYGFQSFPDWKTIESFTKPEDRELTSEVMLMHQKHPKGNQLIKKYMGQYFRTPKTFKDFVYVSQLLQAEGIGKAIEAQRRAKPYCMGTLYWQLNDVWPVASWSSIDSKGKWKALQYKAKEVYADILLTAVVEKETLRISIVNDNLFTSGELTVQAIDFTGKTVFMDVKEVMSKTNSSEEMYNVTFKTLLADLATPKNVYVLLSFKRPDKPLIQRVCYLVKPKDLELFKVNIIKELTPTEGGYIMKFKAPYLMKNVYISTNTEGVFDNNYFDLLPNKEFSIFYKTTAKSDDVMNTLEVRSLIDTY